MADSRDEANRESLEDQGKGFAKELEGKGRNALGGLEGDASKQFKGKAEELEGKARRKFGEAEQPPKDDNTR